MTKVKLGELDKAQLERLEIELEELKGYDGKVREIMADYFNREVEVEEVANLFWRVVNVFDVYFSNTITEPMLHEQDKFCTIIEHQYLKLDSFVLGHIVNVFYLTVSDKIFDNLINDIIFKVDIELNDSTKICYSISELSPYYFLEMYADIRNYVIHTRKEDSTYCIQKIRICIEIDGETSRNEEKI